MLREKIFRESIINITETNLLITMIVSIKDPFMNSFSTPLAIDYQFLCS